MGLEIRRIMLTAGFLIIGNLAAKPNAGQVSIGENVSFLHATMQVLFHNNYFQDFLKTPALTEETSQLIQGLQTHMNTLEASKETGRMVFSGALRKALNTGQNNGEVDVYTFFQQFIEQLTNNITNTHTKNDLATIFTTQVEHKIFSTPKNVISRRVVTQQGLSVKTHVGKNLEDIFNHFCAQQQEPLLASDNFQLGTPLFKRYQKNEILRLPSVLIIHFDRSQNDSLEEHQTCLTPEIDASKWCKNLDNNHNDRYKLTAVIMRTQTKITPEQLIPSTHYFAYTIDNDQQWYKYDEHRVSPIKDIETIGKRDNGPLPYMLFYERIEQDIHLPQNTSLFSDVINTVKVVFKRLKNTLIKA